jgi:hypothetical protein
MINRANQRLLFDQEFAIIHTEIEKKGTNNILGFVINRRYLWLHKQFNPREHLLIPRW